MDVEVGTGREPVQVPLERPPLWSGGLFAAFVVVLALALWLLTELYPRLVEGVAVGELAQPLITVGCLLAVLLAVMGRRVYVRLQTLPPITFGNQHVSLPPSLEATGPTSIPYTDILGTVVRGSGGGQAHLLIEAVHHVYLYPAGAFTDERALERVLNEFRLRIIALPDGAAVMERMERRALLAHKLVAKAPIVTQALIGVNIVFFANLLLLDALESPLGLISWGANVPALVWRGDLFRLVASSFLHAGLMHVVMELLALYAVGALLERVLGRTRFLVLYLSSALCGAVTTASVGAAAVSVGATGGVYGLVASMALICRRLRIRLPVGIRQPRRWWAFIITVSLMLALSPLAFYGFGLNLDLAGPAAGAVTGVCLAFLWMLVRPVVNPLQPPNRRAKVAAVVLGCAYAVGLGLAVASAARFDSDREHGIASVLVTDEGTEAGFLNYLAWMWGIDADAAPRQIGLAADAARRAVEEQPNRADFRDTLATAHFRAGQLDDAIAVERQALAASHDDSFMASQLARFLDARVAETGPIGGEVERVREAVKLRFIPGGGTRDTPARVVVGTGGSLGGGALVYALAKDGDDLLGLMRLHVRAGTPVDRELALRPSFEYEHWPESTKLVVALAESLDDLGGPAGGGELQWRVWPMDIRAARLP